MSLVTSAVQRRRPLAGPLPAAPAPLSDDDPGRSQGAGGRRPAPLA